MIFIFLRFFMFLIFFTIWVLLGGNCRQTLSKWVLWLFAIQKINVYGTIDKDARIFAFNHPSLADGLVLSSIMPNISALMNKSRDLFTWIIGTVTNSIFVSDKGNNNTHARLKEILRNDNQRKRKIIISAHKYYFKNKDNPPSYAGLIPNEKMKHTKTIAFALGERVQPIIIIYHSPKYISCEHKEIFNNLNWDSNFANEVSVYLLPSTIQGKEETVKEFAERNHKLMDECIERAWKNIKPQKTTQNTKWIQSQNILTTGFLFFTVAIHALFKKKYSYALAWITLMITSFIYWGSQMTHTRILDQVMVWTVIVMGALLYKPFKIVPLVSFITTGLIYISNIFINKNWLHQIVHLISTIGHHSILFGL